MCDVKNLQKLLFLFLVSATLFACTTNDVVSNIEEIDEKDYFEIPDVAFGEYLLYNTTRTDDNKLPGNLILKKDGKIFLDKKVATEVAILYLVKDTKRVEALAAAGVVTADQKIVNLDGIQYFTNVTQIKLTSNDVVGKLDLSMLTKLDTLEMNSNYVNELIVPASVTRLRFAASSSAPENAKLTAIDVSANSNLEHLHLPNHSITVAELKLPTNFSKLTYLDLSGNTDAPFAVPDALYNQLETKNGVVSAVSIGRYQISDLAFADYLKYNSILDATDPNKLPDGIVVEKDGKMMLDKNLASSVLNLYLVKDTKRMEALAAAGVATANQKIVNLDGIQFFTSVEEIKLTSNEVVGKLDFSMLPNLKTLEMNSNYVNELIVPASLTRLRYAASTSSSAPENRWLTAIDLSNNSNMDHIHLPNHKITTEGLKLPTDFSKLTYIDLTGNTDAPFTIPADLFNQLQTKKGVAADTPTNLFQLADAAFADYLKYNSTLAADHANKLPEGIVVEQDGKMMLDKTLAASVTNLNIVKSSSRITDLTAAGVPTAAQKIVNLSGIQFFTNLETITMTSNDVVGKLDLSMLTKLKTLEMNSNYVNELIVPASLTRLRYAASTSSSAPDNRWLTAIDLSKNNAMDHIHLPNHKIMTEGLKLPTDYSKLTYIDLTGNTGAPFAIPAALFNQLTTKSGVVSQ